MQTLLQCAIEQDLSDVEQGIVENFETISPIFSKPVWHTTERNDGLIDIVVDADMPVGTDYNHRAARICSCAKHAARRFLKQVPGERFIVGNPAIVFHEVRDGITRIHFYVGRNKP